MQTVSVTTTTEQKKKQQEAERFSRWAVAVGLGLTFAIGTATTVYYLKTRQKRSLKALRYGDDYATENNYKKKLVKYWNFGVRTFQAVTSVVFDFLKPKPKTKQAAPLVNAAEADTCLIQPSEDAEL